MFSPNTFLNNCFNKLVCCVGRVEGESMIGENLPGKPLLVLSLEDSTCFSCFGVSFGSSLDEICQVLSNDFFGPAGISNTLSVFPFSSSVLEKIEGEALTLWVFGRNHGSIRAELPTQWRTCPVAMAAPAPAAFRDLWAMWTCLMSSASADQLVLRGSACDFYKRYSLQASNLSG